MWEFLLQREVVIAFAVAGAIAASIGAWMRHKGAAPGIGGVVYWSGYTLTGISIGLFILAGLWGVEP